MQRNGGSWRLDMDILLPPSADGGRSASKNLHQCPLQPNDTGVSDAGRNLTLNLKRAPDADENSVRQIHQHTIAGL